MQPGDAEREIMARIRSASARLSPEAIAAERDALRRPAAAALRGADLLEVFCDNLRRNGASVVVAADRDAAVEAISDFLAARHRQRRVVAGHDPRLAALPWRVGSLLPRFAAAGPGDAACPSATPAAASPESGSAAAVAGPPTTRRATTCCARITWCWSTSRNDLVPRLEGIVWTTRETGRTASALPSRGLMLISGPVQYRRISPCSWSLGAHGPRCWHVVLVGSRMTPELLQAARDLAAGKSYLSGSSS
jgi:L-lactate dehydrogenase complex protein LldG